MEDIIFFRGIYRITGLHRNKVTLELIKEEEDGNNFMMYQNISRRTYIANGKMFIKDEGNYIEITRQVKQYLDVYFPLLGIK
jgi:DNA/RNA endonuclease YhcR with UshA esterase domain